jgi:hypothetical protein
MALLAAVGGCDGLMAVGPVAVPNSAESDLEVDPSFSDQFDGAYVLDDETFSEAAGEDEESASAGLNLASRLFSPLRINRNVIRYGKLIEGEFRLTSAEVDGNVLQGDAMWHEDVHDPGDYSEVKLTLEKDGDLLRLTYQDAEEGLDDFAPTLIYRKARP